MTGTFDFRAERKIYDHVRPQYEEHECVFVPDNSSGLSGYVTFESDAMRLRWRLNGCACPHTPHGLSMKALSCGLWTPVQSEQKN